MPFIDTARGQFYCVDYRQYNNPRTPTLMIHGAAGVHLDYSIQMRRAPEMNAIAVDLSGHGLTTGEGHPTMDGHVLDMLALLDTLDIPKANIVGHSMGAGIALTMVLDYPSRVDRLVVIGGGTRLPVTERLPLGVLEVAEDVARILVQWSWRQETAEAILNMGINRLKAFNPLVLRRDFMACDAFDIRARIGEITAPTLILAGTADKMTPVAFAEALHAGIGQSTLITLPDAGHMLQLEDPAGVARLIAAWVIQ